MRTADPRERLARKLCRSVLLDSGEKKKKKKKKKKESINWEGEASLSPSFGAARRPSSLECCRFPLEVSFAASVISAGGEA